MPRRSRTARYRLMSFLARYFNSLRRRPTSSSSPRRLWWSCLCTLRCSVRSEIRLVNIATCTSGDPVSRSAVAYLDMISVFWAESSAMFSLCVAMDCVRAHGVVQAAGLPPVTRRTPKANRPADSATNQDVSCPRHVLANLLDQRLDAVVPAHFPQVSDEVEGHALAVQVAVEVQNVCLDAPVRAGKRGIRPDRHRRHLRLLPSPYEPSGIHAV